MAPHSSTLAWKIPWTAEKLELSYTVDGNVQSYNYFGKQFGNFLKS